MFLTGGLRHFVSESGEMRGWDDVCVYVCVLELSVVSSGGVIRVTYCKQIFVGISKSAGWSVCSLPFCNFLFHIHTNTYKAGRQINTPTHAFTHISYLLDRGFSRSLCAHCHRVSLSPSLSLPLSLTAGPPACFTVSRKRVKPVLSFPPHRSKLPGGENRLCSRPCPNLSPRWSGKQTVELPERSKGTCEPAGYFNRAQDEK